MPVSPPANVHMPSLPSANNVNASESFTNRVVPSNDNSATLFGDVHSSVVLTPRTVHSISQPGAPPPWVVNKATKNVWPSSSINSTSPSYGRPTGQITGVGLDAQVVCDTHFIPVPLNGVPIATPSKVNTSLTKYNEFGPTHPTPTPLHKMSALSAVSSNNNSPGPVVPVAANSVVATVPFTNHSANKNVTAADALAVARTPETSNTIPPMN